MLNALHDDPAFDVDEFETREKALGFRWSPYNLLGDPDMDPYLDVPNQFFHDWMHMIFVGAYSTSRVTISWKPFVRRQRAMFTPTCMAT